MSIAPVCDLWARRQGSEALAAVQGIVALRELCDGAKKALGRRLRNFLVQAAYKLTSN